VLQRPQTVEILPGHTVPGTSWVPREHQKVALDAVRERRRGLVQHSTGCLAGDTIIECNRAGWSFKIRIDELAKRLHGERIGRGGGPRWDLSTPTLARYRDQSGHIRLGRVADAYSSGTKLTYVVTTECGKVIRATADHRFLTAEGWKPLSQVGAGSFVWVASGTSHKVGNTPTKKNYHITSGLKNHPYAGRRNVKGGYSVATHRLVMEASLNEVNLQDFVKDLRSPGVSVDKYTFLDPKVFAVHHLDENHRNNRIDNLAVETHKNHAKLHGEESGWRHVTEGTRLSRVVSIVENIEAPTYDISMEDEPHNFLANGFVVHNSGKGDLIGALAALIQGRVLIIATSKKLQDDLVSRCRKFHVHPGQLGSGHNDVRKRVVVCNDDSLKKLSKHDLLSFQAVLADECHGVASKTLQSTIMKCVNAEIRIGFSATALDRADKKGLFIVGALGETIHRYTPQQAAADGVISKARLFMPSYQHRYLQDTETYVDWEKLAIASNPTRNLMILRLVHETKAPRIVFVRTKLHQQLLVELLGDSCGYVNDETPTDKADHTVKDLRSGRIGTLVSTPIYRQGVDIPEIKTVINAAGGKATIDVIQKVGRGSRILQPDGSKKESFEVYDIKDTGCGCLGEIHKSCEWLHKHSTERRKAYEKYGYIVEEMP
jgi:superfamily II DNA or RNA helicase